MASSLRFDRNSPRLSTILLSALSLPSVGPVQPTNGLRSYLTVIYSVEFVAGVDGTARENGFGAEHGPTVTEGGQQTRQPSAGFSITLPPSAGHGEPTCASHMGGKKFSGGLEEQPWRANLFRSHPRLLPRSRSRSASGLFARALTTF